jgi:hypothetical protein
MLVRYLLFLWPNIHCARSFFDFVDLEREYKFVGLNERLNLEQRRELDGYIERLRTERA